MSFFERMHRERGDSRGDSPLEEVISNFEGFFCEKMSCLLKNLFEK